VLAGERGSVWLRETLKFLARGRLSERGPFKRPGVSSDPNGDALQLWLRIVRLCRRTFRRRRLRDGAGHNYNFLSGLPRSLRRGDERRFHDAQARTRASHSLPAILVTPLAALDASRSLPQVRSNNGARRGDSDLGLTEGEAVSRPRDLLGRGGPAAQSFWTKGAPI
jgi:hypothetical protein